MNNNSDVRRSNTSRADILVVEDSPTQAQKLAWLLEQANYSVRTVSSGREALQRMKVQLPDLVITDVVMPEMDGYELSETIRNEFGFDVPVMLVTSLKSASDVLRGLKVGADNFLTKPYQNDYLLDQVDYLLSNKRLRGKRKMELGIEIEFGGERHFITADRQQILDLLISTYHESVYLNQELEHQSMKLKKQLQLQNIQMRLSNDLQACVSVEELFCKASKLLVSLEQVEAVWFCEGLENDHIKVLKSTHPHLKSGKIVPQCTCMKTVASDAENSPKACLLTESLQSQGKHHYLPLKFDKGHAYSLHFFLTEESIKYEDLSTFFATCLQQIETNLDRITLLNALEKKVELRTTELANSEKRFRAISESALFGVAIVSGDLIVEFLNDTAKSLLKYQNLQDIKLREVINLNTIPATFNKDIDASWMGRPFPGEMIDADGNALSALLMLSPLNDDTPSLLLSFIDLTDLKKAEDKLAHMQRLESVASLSGGIAHDFNNLLSIILGSTDTLTDNTATLEEKREATQSIIRAASSGSELSNQLLTFARRKPVRGEFIKVSSFFTSLSKFIQRLLPTNIQLSFICESPELEVFTDYGQLENVFINLAINSRDAMPNGGQIIVSAELAERINDVETLTDSAIKGDFVKIEVKDNGIGIPPEIQEKIIEPFFTTKEEGKGTGLGLAMVYGFIKQCNGYIKIESNGEGTTVTLLLPLAHSIDFRLKENPLLTNATNSSGESILIVEDNEEVALIVKRHLTALGYKPFLATSFQKAKLLLTQNCEDIALVITDYFLDGKHTGEEIVSLVGKISPSIPVILATGSDFNGFQLSDYNHSKYKLLRKPYRREELNNVIKELLPKS